MRKNFYLRRQEVTFSPPSWLLLLLLLSPTIETTERKVQNSIIFVIFNGRRKLRFYVCEINWQEARHNARAEWGKIKLRYNWNGKEKWNKIHFFAAVLFIDAGTWNGKFVTKEISLAVLIEKWVLYVAEIFKVVERIAFGRKG
jgi:hypothetical protein